MSTFYFPQYPSKNSKRLGRPFYWTNEWQHYPKLFTKGYAHFKYVIQTHNRLRPTDPWPLWSYKEWLPKAKYFAKNKHRRKHRSKAEQYKRFNQRFYNWIISEYGAWPSYKNPKFMATGSHNVRFVSEGDLKSLKQYYFNQRIAAAARRAYKKTYGH